MRARITVALKEQKIKRGGGGGEGVDIERGIEQIGGINP